MFFTYLSIGYMISRGLAKAGSREPYRADCLAPRRRPS
jgi:hypothetical protein